MKVDTITPQMKPVLNKIGKKGVAIAAGIALGVAAGALYNNSKSNVNQNTAVEYNMNAGNLTSDTVIFNNRVVKKGHEFNSENDLVNQGKTRHWCVAKNGPDKGSKYYRSSDYSFFGYYKK